MNAVGYLSQKRVNIELLLFTNNDAIIHIGVRLRPWKQDPRNQQMILVQGLDIADCLDNAARALWREEWRRLDYAARPWNNITFDKETGSEVEELDFLASRPLSVVPLDMQEAQRAIKKSRAALEPS